MRKRSFNRGISKLMNRGYPKQNAFDTMKGLARKNRNIQKNLELKVPPWARYLVALLFQILLITYKVPSKEGVQIMLIKTLIPLSDATKPLAGIVTIIALIMQALSLLLIYDIIIKLLKALKKKFRL